MYDFDPKKDYYKILWVSEDATTDDIKKTFKKLAVKYHPDKKGGDKAKFQAANEAHQVLSDKQKRQQYDTVRKGGFWGLGWGGFDVGGFQGQSGGFDFGGVDLWDIMWSIFGGWFGGRWEKTKRASKGDDIKHMLEISFEESFLGTEKKIAYTRYDLVIGATKEECPNCKGRGTVTQQVQTAFGVMQTQRACQACQGVGVSYKKDWKVLPNNWLEQHKETIDVKIPAGIKDGVYVKFTGKGHAGFGGAPAGDLYIQIRIKWSKIYKRKGNDLYVKAKLTIFDLVLGGTCEVPHPEGKLKIKVPKWTQFWALIKVSGKGFGESGLLRSKGSLYVESDIHIPKRLSKKQEKLWKELQRTS